MLQRELRFEEEWIDDHDVVLDMMEMRKMTQTER